MSERVGANLSESQGLSTNYSPLHKTLKPRITYPSFIVSVNSSINSLD